MNAPKPGTFADEGTLADKLHNANIVQDLLESELFDTLIRIFGDPDKYDTWPCEDTKTDSYDNSVELLGCRDDLTLDEGQARRILDLGFYQGWLNWNDGTEIHFSRDQKSRAIHIGKRRKRGE